MRFAGRFVLVHDLLGIDLVVVRVVGFMGYSVFNAV